MRSSKGRALTSAVKNGWEAICSESEDMMLLQQNVEKREDVLRAGTQ
jgi:hypothetical protein